MRALFFSMILWLCGSASAFAQTASNLIKSDTHILIIMPMAEIDVKMANAKSRRHDEWSKQARHNITAALNKAIRGQIGQYESMGVNKTMTPQQTQLIRLSTVIAQSPNYGRVKTIGPNANVLGNGKADYALISIVRGAYKSRGKKLMNIASSTLVGYSDGREQRASLILVDTQTGDIFWSRSTKLKKDVRTVNGAAEIVDTLLRGYPTYSKSRKKVKQRLYQGEYAKFLTQNWTVRKRKTGKGKTVQVLTLDGPALNALYLFKDIRKGDELFRTDNFDTQMPRYNKKLSDDEKIAFIKETLEKGLGYKNINIHNIVRANNSLNFDLSGTSSGGLNVLGKVLMADLEKGLSMAVFIAPREYYYAREKVEIESFFGALTNGF